MSFNRIGGIAALIETLTFVFGFVLLLTVMAPYIENQDNMTVALEFVVENHHVLYVWNSVIYLLFGVCLVVLVLALDQRLKTGFSVLRQIATIFGLIWSGLVIASGMVANVGIAKVVDLAPNEPELASHLLLTINTIVNGLGGGNEIVGGLWVLLVSVAAWQPGTLPRILIGIGLVAGAAGVATVIPSLEALGALFGLALIIWFLYVGVVMLWTT